MAKDANGKWINPKTLSDRERQDRYLESKGLLNYQTKGQSAAQVAQKYAQAGVNVQAYNAEMPPPQYANVTQPQVQINVPQSQQAGGSTIQQPAMSSTSTPQNGVQYNQDPNTGMVIKQKYQTVWLNGDPALKAQQEAQAQQQNKPLFGTIDQAKGGQVNWGDVSVNDRKAALSDPNFYKTNEITKYEPWMQQQILADPNFQWDKLPKWQKTYFELSSNPAGMGAAQGLVMGAGNPGGAVVGAALGWAGAKSGYDQNKEFWQQSNPVSGAFGLMNWMAEQAEKGIGMGAQIVNAAADPNKAVTDVLNKESWNAGAGIFEAFAPAFQAAVKGDGKLTMLDALKIVPAAYVAERVIDAVIHPENYKGQEIYLGANAPVELDQSWIDRIDAARQEIKNGRNYREVMTEMQTGIMGQLGDMAGQGIADPLNVMPKAEVKISGAIAEATGNKVAAEAFRTSDAPVEAARKYKTLVQTGQAMTIDPNFKVDQMGMFSKYVAGLNSKGEVRAGSLWFTDKGLLAPVPAKDTQGWIKNMAEQTPQSRAQTGANMFYENIRALLTTFEDPHEAGKYLRALSNNDMDTWAGLGTRFAESPEFYTVLPALKDFNAGKLDAVVQAWDTSAPNRDMLTRIADVLGEQPASLLDDLANKGTPEQDFRRVIERLQKSSDPKAQALLKDVEAGRLSADSMKQMVDLFTGEGALAWHPGQWKAEMLDSLGTHFDEWVTKRLMLDKSPEAVSAFYRTTALMKQAQSILLLGGSPGYAITNGLSNMVHRAATGIYGYMTTKQIDGFMDRLGITPARMDEGVGIGGQVEQAAGTSGVKTEAQVKATRGQGPLTAAKDALAKIARGMPMSKLSAWFEKTESRQAFAIPMKEFWSNSWRRGVGFSKMSPELANVIKGMGQDPNRIYAAIEAGMNQTEIENILTGRQADVQARSLIHDAAQKTGLSATQAATMLEKIGVLDTLDTYLKGQTTRDGVQAAFARANKTAQDFLDMQTGEDLKATAEAVKQRVGLEGAASGLDVVQKAHGAYTDAWLEHYYRFGEVMNDLTLLDDEAKRSKAIDAAYQQSDDEFRRVNARNAANYKGIFDAWGMSGNADALNVLSAIGESDTVMGDAYRQMREIRKGFFDKYRNDFDNPTKWDEWDANSNQIDRIFKQAFEAKAKADVKMGNSLAKIYEGLYGPAAGEAARLWWKDVVDFNAEITKREQDFRAQTAEARRNGATKEQIDAQKQKYYSETKPYMIAELDKINGDGIARLDRVINKGKGGGLTADGGPQNPTPLSPTETSPQIQSTDLGGETPATPDQQRTQVIAEAEAKRARTQQDNVDEFNALMAAAEQRKAADANEAKARESAVWEVAADYWGKGGNYDKNILQDKFALLAALNKYGDIMDVKSLSDPRLTPERVRAILEARKEVKAAQANEAAAATMQNFKDAAQERKAWDVTQINEDTTLLRAIALHGGIDLSIAKDLTGEKRPKSAPGVFTKKGVNIDEMARMLADDGYPIDVNNPEDPGGIRQATELISRARAGDKVYPVGHDYSAQLDAAEKAYADTFNFENVQEIDPALWQAEFTDTLNRGDLTKMWGMIGEYPEAFDQNALTDYIRMADETAARVEAEARDLDVATHLTRAEEQIAQAQTRAEAATTRQMLKEKFQEAFDLSDVEAQAYMELSDSVAAWYAKMTGEDADAFYSRYYGDVVKVDGGEGQKAEGGTQLDQGWLQRADVYQIDRVRSEYKPTKRTDWVSAAIEQFGITNDLKEAGYILPDGKLLDLSGKQEGGQPGNRGLDHRDIAKVVPSQGTQALLDFASETGAIRISDMGGDLYVDLIGTVPTVEQISALKRATVGKNITFDITDTRGNTILSGDLPGKRTSVDRIINEARRLFEGTESGQDLETAYGALFQNVEGQKSNVKGAVTFGADGIKATIHAFEAKDFSTLIHENGHVFRRVLADVAERTNNPYIKADLATIEEWAGAKNGWDRAAEEKFARGFEQYITEGRAPTPKLKAAFESFKGWMLSIYKTITGSAIDAKINDDVRRIFDRMLGAENLKLDMDAMLLQMNYDPKVYYINALGIPSLKVENLLDGDADSFDALKSKAQQMKARMQSGEVKANTDPATQPKRQAIDPNRSAVGGGGYQGTRYEGHSGVTVGALQDLSQWTEQAGSGQWAVDSKVQANLEKMQANRQKADGAALFQTAEPVDTPAFKNWFGDSKVVDENGSPLVVYHGTKADFTEFRLDKFGQTDEGWFGEGFYFTPDKKQAGIYATGDKMGNDKPQGNIMPVYIKAEKPFKTYEQAFTQEYVDQLKSEGYDAIFRFENRGDDIPDEIVVFEPTQIKSTANRGTFDPNNPNILFQEADTPFGAYDEASGFHPQSEVMDQGWTRDVMPLMKAMEQGAMEQVGGGQLGVDSKTNPEGSAMLRQYMRQVQNEMATTKLATVRWGESQRDFALLNYNKRYGLDRVADSIVPYQFYTSRSAMTWAARILDKPALYANYARLRKQQDRYERDIPERLRGKIKINAPWLPEWMGGSLYIDPITNLFFPANLLRNFERKQQEKNYQQIETERILQEWAADGQYSQAQVAAAARDGSGTIYERAAAEAQIRRESETANPLDFFTSFFGPAWYATTPLNLAGIRVPGISSGNKSDITPLPLGNTARALDTVTQGTWAEPVGDIIGLIGKAEDWGRKKFNLPTRGEYGEYYTKRQIANLVVEGKISSEEAQIAMLEKTGKIWEEAAQRVDMELAMRVPGASTIYAALHDGPVSGARAFLPSLFGAGLLPSGELEYRGMKQEWNEAWKKADAGDTAAVSEFFDEHPEYQAYLAKGKDDDELMRSFLIGQIWDGYMELGTTNQKQARAEMGELFQQSFLNKETRSYDTLDVDTLIQWARVMDGMIPKTAQTAPAMSQPAPQVPLYDPYVTDVTDQFFSERTKNFPDYYEVQAGYYALPKSERKAYLFKNPELKQYWDWKDNWYNAYPQYKPIFNGNAFDRVDTSAWPPMLEDYVRTYALTGQRIPQGASAALMNVWIMEGQPMDNYQTWLDSTVVPGMIYGGQ